MAYLSSRNGFPDDAKRQSKVKVIYTYIIILYCKLCMKVYQKREREREGGGGVKKKQILENKI
jgi:hypothetical protein